MSLVDFAKRELAILDPDRGLYDGMIADAVVEIVEKFSSQGHSGYSARMMAALLEKLLRYEPLTPLTGEDSEWVEVGAGAYQNNRCSHVFKENDQAYDIEGYIFRDPDGTCVVGSESRKNVTFPYTPKSEIVDRPAEPD